MLILRNTKNKQLIAAIEECGGDVNKIFDLVKNAYAAGYNKGKNDMLTEIFTYNPEED